MGGSCTFPGGGWYHASKHAVEALSDALRFEVEGFGIDVVVIQPGLIRTGFADTAVGSIAVEPDGPTAASTSRGRGDGGRVRRRLARVLGGGPDDVARRSSGRSPRGARGPATA